MTNTAATFAFTTSQSFSAWLASTGGGLAFTTYQAGKLFMLGTKPDGQLSIFERTFPRSMGLGVTADGRSLALTTEYQIHRFDNLLREGQTSEQGYDALYAPHAGWVTGDVDAHDVGFDADGRPIFVNTLFGCIAAVSDAHSFRPLWKPGFVSRLAPEDRCHLNGMAMEGGEPRYATAVARTDTAQGWRDYRRDGGVAIDVRSGAAVAEGLSMPHSPRLHEGRLWLLNSGAGGFGHVDVVTGVFEAIAFCPGYARGLAFSGGHAVVGLSLPRDNRTFAGLPLDSALEERGDEARCGLMVVDITSGEVIAWARIAGIVSELYDVVFLPGARRPALVGFKTDEVKHLISVEN